MTQSLNLLRILLNSMNSLKTKTVSYDNVLHSPVHLRMEPSDLMVRIMSLLSVSAIVLCSQVGISERRLTRGLGPQPW